MSSVPRASMQEGDQAGMLQCSGLRGTQQRVAGTAVAEGIVMTSLAGPPGRSTDGGWTPTWTHSPCEATARFCTGVGGTTTTVPATSGAVTATVTRAHTPYHNTCDATAKVRCVPWHLLVASSSKHRRGEAGTWGNATPHNRDEQARMRQARTLAQAESVDKHQRQPTHNKKRLASTESCCVWAMLPLVPLSPSTEL